MKDFVTSRMLARIQDEDVGLGASRRLPIAGKVELTKVYAGTEDAEEETLLVTIVKEEKGTLTLDPMVPASPRPNRVVYAAYARCLH